MPPSSRPGGVPLPYARTSRSDRTTYNAYCVNGCHVSNPSTGVSGAKTPSQTSWSRHTSSYHGGRYTCQNCHDWHGSPGTSPVQRGRMIVNFGVRSYPYGGESTCSASGTPSGMSFSCH